MDWVALQAAIHAWAVSGSGLDADHVIWGEQAGPRPTVPYVSLKVTQIDAPRQDWHDTEDNPDATPGAELLVKARGVRAASLSVQCFGGDGTGLAMATAILNDVLSSLALPSVGDALRDAGVGVADFGSVRSISGVLGATVFEPRAQVDVRLNLVTEKQETTTFIETVQVTPTIDGVDQPIITAVRS